MMRVIKSVVLAMLLAGSLAAAPSARAETAPGVAVAPQYDTTHVYVAPADFDKFVASLTATGSMPSTR